MSALELVGASMAYGTAQVLHAVDLSVQPGTVHAVVGENGAGKSTALKLLAGLERPTAGQVVIDGAPVALGSRLAAIRLGVGLVPQQLSLVPDLTLAENLALSQPSPLVRRRRSGSALRDAAGRAGLAIDTDVPVRRLGLAQRQVGEIAIALAQGARSLLLDEPTSALGPFETAALFEHVRALAAAGCAVVLITHRIDEVRSVADEVTVLSRGRVALSAAVSTVSDTDLVRAMVGHVPPVERPSGAPHGPVRLRLSGVSAGTGTAVLDIDLEVRGGEVVGVLGVAGNGQTALAQAAAGATALHSGTVQVDGTEVGGRPDRAAAAGLAHVPEVRSEALLPDAPLTRSAVLRALGTPGRLRRRGVIDWRAARGFTADLLARHDVRPPRPELLARSLSGGNQQKLLVGRELDSAPSVAVLHGPTQGLDLHASAVIRSEVRRAASAGTAVLLVSADTDEVRELADRIVVLSRGRIVDAMDAADFDTQRIGRAMAGLASEVTGA